MSKVSQRKPGLFNSHLFFQCDWVSLPRQSTVQPYAIPQQNERISQEGKINDLLQNVSCEATQMDRHRRQLSLHLVRAHEMNEFNLRGIGDRDLTGSFKVGRANTEPIQSKQMGGLRNLNPQIALPKILPKPYFPRPYLENTKFVDSMVINRNLLRRGQFDTPLQQHMKQSRERTMVDRMKSRVSERQQAVARSCSLLRKELEQKRAKQSKRAKKLRLIHDRVQKCAQQYESMFEEEEKDPVRLSNSMNRMLAVATIKKKLGISI